MIDRTTYRKLRTAVQRFIDNNSEDESPSILKTKFFLYYPFNERDVEEAWPKICEDLNLDGEGGWYYQYEEKK